MAEHDRAGRDGISDFAAGEVAQAFAARYCVGPGAWALMIDLSGRLLVADPNGPVWAIAADDAGCRAMRFKEYYKLFDPDSENLCEASVTGDTLSDVFASVLADAGLA